MYQDFSSKIFCLIVLTNFLGHRFRLLLILGIENIYALEGYVTILRGNFFYLTMPKHFVEEPFCAISEIFW